MPACLMDCCVRRAWSTSELIRLSAGEHEASRRMKTELLVQMDGCNPTAAQCQLLLVGATNRPEVCLHSSLRQLTTTAAASSARHAAVPACLL